jgi:hypothetical protein
VKLFDIGWITCWMLLLSLIDDLIWYMILCFESMCYSNSFFIYCGLKNYHAWCMVRNCEDGEWHELSLKNIDWDWEKSTLCVVELNSRHGPEYVSPPCTKRGVKPFQLRLIKRSYMGQLALAKRGVVTRWLAKEMWIEMLWGVRSYNETFRVTPGW